MIRKYKYTSKPKQLVIDENSSASLKLRRNIRLKQANIVLLACAFVCLACYDIVGGLWLKGVTSSWFVVLGGVNLWAVRKAQRNQLRFFILMEAGLFCGMCADVLLGVAFLAGIGVFALGHILYLLAFYSLEKGSLLDLWLILLMSLISVFVVVGTPWITVEDPILKKLLLSYAITISAMVGKAISNLVRKPCLYRCLLTIGSVMFWFSDFMLAIDMFGQASRLTWLLCSYSYWPAQNLLAHSLFHTGICLEREKSAQLSVEGSTDGDFGP